MLGLDLNCGSDGTTRARGCFRDHQTRTCRRACCISRSADVRKQRSIIGFANKNSIPASVRSAGVYRGRRAYVLWIRLPGHVPARGQLRGSYSQRRKPRRPACRTARKIRADHQPSKREGVWVSISHQCCWRVPTRSSNRDAQLAEVLVPALRLLTRSPLPFVLIADPVGSGYWRASTHLGSNASGQERQFPAIYSDRLSSTGEAFLSCGP